MMTSKIDKLPDCVLSEIFLLLVTRQFHSFERGRPSRRAPWNTAAVCSRWRSLCLDDPRVWRFISAAEHKANCGRVEGYDPDNSAQPGQQNPAKTCTNGLDLVRCYLQLKRSRNLLLRVDATDFVDCDSSTNVLQATLFHGRRWGSFSFGCKKPSVFDDFRLLVPDGISFPQLYSLDCLGVSAETPAETPFVLADGISSLHTLRLSPCSAPVENFPWHQLHTLALVNIGSAQLISTADLVRVLQKSSNIVVLAIRISHMGDPEQPSASADPTTLPNLAVLDVRGVTSMNRLLPSFLTPHLRSIKWPIVCNPESYTALSNLIARSQCRVTRLALTGYRYKDAINTATRLSSINACIQPLYRQLPYLEILIFTKPPGKFHIPSPWVDMFLKPLIGFDSDGFPRSYHHWQLHQLTILNVDVNPALLVGFVEAHLPQNFSRAKSNLEPQRFRRLEVTYRDTSKGKHQYLQATVASSLSDVHGLELEFDQDKFLPIFEYPAPKCMA